MLICCFVVIIALLLLLSGGLFYVYKKAESEINYAKRNFSDIRGYFVDFFTPGPDEGEPSDFQKTVDALAEVQAQRIGVTIQAAIRGQLGGAMNGIVPALTAEASDHLKDNPDLVDVAFQQSLPKSLKKNPLAQIVLQHFIGKFVSNLGNTGPGTSPQNGRSSGQVKFKL